MTRRSTLEMKIGILKTLETKPLMYSRAMISAGANCTDYKPTFENMITIGLIEAISPTWKSSSAVRKSYQRTHYRLTPAAQELLKVWDWITTKLGDPK